MVHTLFYSLTLVIKRIREEHNIVGIPIGTLLQLPTQNLFLGLPIEYTPEEISLLKSRDAIVILNGVHASRALRTKRKPIKSSPYGMYAILPQKWGRGEKFLPEPPDAEPLKPEEQISSDVQVDRVMAGVYEFLNRAGYWMTPGLRFGCEYTAYPGDPLRYHSHFMVHVEKEGEEVDMLTLVGGGRVATQTRKGWMLAGDVDGDIRVFSIEWAGFG
jgi:tRNA-splicing endonuclease subunit Sen34